MAKTMAVVKGAQTVYDDHCKPSVSVDLKWEAYGTYWVLFAETCAQEDETRENLGTISMHSLKELLSKLTEISKVALPA